MPEQQSGKICAARNAEVTTATVASSVESAALRLHVSVRDAELRTNRERIFAASAVLRSLLTLPRPVHLKPHPRLPNILVTPEQPDASTTLDGEHKTVTALFADITGR